MVRAESGPPVRDGPCGTETGGIVHLGALPRHRHRSNSKVSIILFYFERLSRLSYASCNRKQAARIHVLRISHVNSDIFFGLLPVGTGATVPVLVVLMSKFAPFGES